MLKAMESGWGVDGFVTLTDSESWVGHIHASQALTMYRQKTGIPSRAVCVGMAANKYSVLDPADVGSLNVVGLDSATPGVISDFIAGRM
jgi:60 kDa SS-A/Ro ribonucleoprotein